MDDPWDRFADLAPSANSAQLFAELHSVCDALVGAKLFTCSSFDLSAGTAERIYTNNDTVYPLTGLKEIVPNRWTKIVLDDRHPFLATDIEELRDIFPDHETIEGLGLGAAINLPVFLSDRLLGTINLLSRNGHYSAASLKALRSIRLPAIVAFQSRAIAI